jgi:hypothetical protein
MPPRARGCTGLQTQLREDALDYRNLQHRIDDLLLSAALRALLKIERRDALEQLGLSEQLTCFIPAIQQRPVMAGSVNSASSPKADLGRKRSSQRPAASWHVCELALPATSGHTSDQEIAMPVTGFKVLPI